MSRLTLKRTLTLLPLLLIGCDWGVDSTAPTTRDDGAERLTIPLEGSLQNPAFSPDGGRIVFTRFRDGYNAGPADLVIYDLESGTIRTLVSNDQANVNLPGSAWSAAIHAVVFSSEREPHDEIYLIDENGSTDDEIQLTDRPDYMAYEPTLSPDGLWVVFESHPHDVEDNGVITKYRVDGSSDYIALTGESGDCRQPNWSPAGGLILYQKLDEDGWGIWVMDESGGNRRRVTDPAREAADGSFSPDGGRIVYSSDEDSPGSANLYAIAVDGSGAEQITHYDGYDGAPSWSPDGATIIFESAEDPDNGPGTSLWRIDAPD